MTISPALNDILRRTGLSDEQLRGAGVNIANQPLRPTGPKLLDAAHAPQPKTPVVARAALNVTATEKPDAVYVYSDECGAPLFEVVRRPGKKFFQRKPDGTPGLDGVRRVPYRLNEVVLAEQVFLPEGEKDAESLRAIGLIASTNPGGANGWRPEFAGYFRGKAVIVMPDQDAPGYSWAERVLHDLTPVARTLKRIDLPGLKFGSGGDVTDWLAAGHKKEELLTIIGKTDFWPPIGTATPENGTVLLAEVERPVQEAPAWPKPLAVEAFHGLAGDVVHTIEPHSEADPAALLIQFLAAFGVAAGRFAYFAVEADRHYSNFNGVIVGQTSKSRKGTSWGNVRRVFEMADGDWASKRILTGLSSGEGLIWAVRDTIYKREAVKKSGRVVDYQEVEADAGITDKRLLVLESEFTSALRMMGRDGNCLSPVVRDSWDRGELELMTKNSPARATGAHIGILGHACREELLRYLNSTEAGNGFANRFLWICAKRSKCLPDGGALREESIVPLADKLREALEFAKGSHDIHRDEEATAMWRGVYPALSEGKPGLLGAVIGRGEAQVVRLSLIYALLDLSNVIRAEHLAAALAVWDYAESSARFIFGESLGYPEADRLLAALRTTPEGLSRSEVSAVFGRHRTESEIDSALRALTESGLAEQHSVETQGRSREVWSAKYAK
ncbi:MAG TPA: hypothetical protein VKA02_03395 [Candidatus Acidoferrum sp.]|nr:hypothetical protein [Candidatus Acidoferrum sp.]